MEIYEIHTALNLKETQPKFDPRVQIFELIIIFKPKGCMK